MSLVADAGCGIVFRSRQPVIVTDVIESGADEFCGTTGTVCAAAYRAIATVAIIVKIAEDKAFMMPPCARVQWALCNDDANVKRSIYVFDTSRRKSAMELTALTLAAMIAR